MFRKLIPILIFLFLIGGGISLYLNSSTTEEQISSPQEEELVGPPQGYEESTRAYLESNDHDRLRETLNLSFRIISGMLSKDYDYLETILHSSVKLNKEKDSFTFGDSAYEQSLMKNFDFNNMEYRGYHFEGDKVYIILGVNNVSYEFRFVEDEANKGSYLLQSYLTN